MLRNTSGARPPPAAGEAFRRGIFLLLHEGGPSGPPSKVVQGGPIVYVCGPLRQSLSPCQRHASDCQRHCHPPPPTATQRCRPPAGRASLRRRDGQCGRKERSRGRWREGADGPMGNFEGQACCGKRQCKIAMNIYNEEIDKKYKANKAAETAPQLHQNRHGQVHAADHAAIAGGNGGGTHKWARRQQTTYNGKRRWHRHTDTIVGRLAADSGDISALILTLIPL